MLTAVTVNPCVDLTMFVRDFTPFATNRAAASTSEVAGKGINVARAFRALGGESFCTGFDFADGEVSPLAVLDAEGMPREFLRVRGKLRTCVKIFDEVSAKMTEVNECGGEVSKDDAEALLSIISRAAEKSDMVTLSGSLPRGLSSDFYARAVRACRAANPCCLVAVDAAGAALLASLDAAPDLIKPNESEFTALFGVPATRETIDEKAKELIAAGKARVVCVSLGERGAYLCTRDEAYFCPAPRVTARSLQAAGDAMLAGIAFAMLNGKSPAEWLTLGTATAGATVSHAGSEVGSRDEIDALCSTLCAQRIR